MFYFVTFYLLEAHSFLGTGTESPKRRAQSSPTQLALGRRPGDQGAGGGVPAHARDVGVRLRSSAEKRQRVTAREALVLGGGRGGRAAWAHTRLEVVCCGPRGAGAAGVWPLRRWRFGVWFRCEPRPCMGFGAGAGSGGLGCGGLRVCSGALGRESGVQAGFVRSGCGRDLGSLCARR